MIVAPANVNSYTTIGDATAGDKIYFIDAAVIDTFVSSAVTLAGSAAFQDYANAAVNGLTTVGNIAKFQYGGDTYIVQQQGSVVATADFESGTDVIVKLTGLVNLSTATLNTDTATLELF